MPKFFKENICMNTLTLNDNIYFLNKTKKKIYEVEKKKIKYLH